MDNPSAVALASDRGSTPSSNDENLRVKLLCSFSGGIMPRPQDGKLRYVGGETRILSLPRDIGYEVLMVRMRELYEDATLLKYQQPDEDVDALVSVVNDDDVTNMMEEYDKLGSGDGFTRLRIFLFSHPEQETSPHFVDAHERNSERRYVDALNSLDEASDFRNHQQSNFSAMSSVDEALIIEQFYNQASLEGSIHNQGSFEMHTPQFNLRRLKIPITGLGQPQQFGTQRYKEVEAPWSPAYYSPRHHGHHDVRPLTEFQSSPSMQLHIPPGDLGDKMPQECIRQQISYQSQCDLHHFTGSVVRLPPGAISGAKTSFQGNLLHGSNVFEGNSIFECRPTNFQRGQAYSDSHWKLGEQSQLEHSNFRNGIHHAGNTYESPPNRETLLLNKDKKLTHRIYLKEQRGPQTLHDELHGHERGWLLQHHLKPQAEEIRTHTSGAGRLTDHYIVDGPAINFSHGHGNLSDDYHESSDCVHHEGMRYIEVGSELGKEVFCDQVVATGPHVHIPLEEHGVQYENPPYAHGAENSYQVSHGHIPAHALQRNSQTPMHSAPYEISNSVQQANGTAYQGFFQSTIEGDPSFITGAQNQSTRVESSSEVLGVVGSDVPEYSYGHTLRLNSSMISQGSHHHFGQDQIQFQPDVADFVTDNEPIQYSHPSSTFTNDKLIISTVSNNNQDSNVDGTVVNAVKRVEKSIGGKGKITDTFDGKPKPNISYPRINEKARKIPKSTSIEPVNFNSLRRPPEQGGIVKPDRSDLSPSVEDSEHSSKKHLKLFDSVKRDALEVLEEAKVTVRCHIDAVPLQVSPIKEAALDELETAIAKEESEYEIEIDNQSTGDIEPSRAEEEAISRGLQTIKNEDLEEIRELGSGTYGAVYYGKWKGSDVAIKRIKASCFAGRPSERDRLISDFWKEAQTLSSLHHPNVVSFYGIVRDGPDKSLATVTEYMVNGSFKQFLKKKDRTIDRRKRLIIAMDTAFGMEYLHGKNIVHFDLKCENLLVNMRDPHRPICKIGDLGLSKVKQRTLVSGGVRGTLSWMAPELLSGKSTMVTEKIDVYSFGIVMWEMLTGEEPYVDRHCASIIGGIVSNSLRPQIPTWCDPEWKSLMESCWASDPVDRPSFLEISHKLRSMAMAINVK